MSPLHLGFFVGWMAPRRRLYYLMESKDVDHTSWEAFRDGLVHRWTNLNIVCGLIMSATTTILFGDFALSATSFAFGVMSLLSSLMAIGFGVGLIYVLSDVHGDTLKVIAHRYPMLYLFSLAIPQVWGGVSFAAFFVYTCIIGWEAVNKGPVLKIGIIATVSILTAHLIGFVFLFRAQEDAKSLIPEPQMPRPTFFGTSSSTRMASKSATPTSNMVPPASNGSDSLVVERFTSTDMTSPIEEVPRVSPQVPSFKHRGTGSATLV